MDLRQLRHRPESELARFKNRLKQIVQRLRYVGWVLFGVSLLISFVLFFVFDLRLMPPKQEAPIKRYGTVFPSQQEGAKGERAASEATTDNLIPLPKPQILLIFFRNSGYTI